MNLSITVFGLDISKTIFIFDIITTSSREFNFYYASNCSESENEVISHVFQCLKLLKGFLSWGSGHSQFHIRFQAVQCSIDLPDVIFGNRSDDHFRRDSLFRRVGTGTDSHENTIIIDMGGDILCI